MKYNSLSSVLYHDLLKQPIKVKNKSLYLSKAENVPELGVFSLLIINPYLLLIVGKHGI